MDIAMLFFSKAKLSSLPGQVSETELQPFIHGASGEIFRGQWIKPSRERVSVAMKYLCRNTSNNKPDIKTAYASLARETLSWAQLHHPHIIPLYGIICRRKDQVLVTPYCRNGDIVTFLKNNPKANKLQLLSQVATALAYLHDHKPNPIVHGDIKASNILITDNHQASLTDIGTKRILGTPDCNIAPTGKSSEPLDVIMPQPKFTTATDVWAFGMTILEVYNKRSQEKGSQRDTNAQTYIDLLSRPSEIDSSLWTLLVRCWNPDPQQRPPMATVSLVLDVMSRQRISPSDVDYLLNLHLDSGSLPADLHNSENSPAVKRNTSTIPEPEIDVDLTSSARTKKISIFRFLNLFYSCSSTRSPSNDLISERDPPPVDPHPFHCLWPECAGFFTTLPSRQAHELQHWFSWKESEEKGTPNVMPGIFAVLG